MRRVARQLGGVGEGRRQCDASSGDEWQAIIMTDGQGTKGEIRPHGNAAMAIG